MGMDALPERQLRLLGEHTAQHPHHDTTTEAGEERLVQLLQQQGRCSSHVVSTFRHSRGSRNTVVDDNIKFALNEGASWSRKTKIAAINYDFDSLSTYDPRKQLASTLTLCSLRSFALYWG